MGPQMTDAKKKRLSMLDSLAAAGAAPAGTAPSMMAASRPLRAARDAVDAHHVWELDPEDIEDARLSDRLDPADVLDLRDAIDTNGQTVPVLVRRHPTEPGRYLLVYGRRRLEAIRMSDKVHKVRALVASMDEDAAVKAQISENMARRDLSFIEKALFARELVESGFGNQSQVAEVLTVTKSSVSMALAIVEMLGKDLVRAIGPAHGIGRPRWEALGKAIEEKAIDRDRLIKIAHDAHTRAEVAMVVDGSAEEPAEVSVQAFEAVVAAVGEAAQPGKAPSPAPARGKVRRTSLLIGGKPGGTLRSTARGISLDIDSGPFADWIQAEGQQLIDDLHARWLQRRED